jgi:protoheme IX farnesyltransferase
MKTEAILAIHPFRDTFSLIKPRITLLAVITAAVGIHLAPGEMTPDRLLITLLGISLLVGGANALNMFLERDVDLLMTRTKDRPLPGKRLTPDFVLGFGALLIGISIPLLATFVNPLTGALGALSLASYVLFYTPLKRKSSLSLLVGAVPGAMPPLLGWTASEGAVGLPAVVMFGIIFLWQVPHFLAIGLFRREEYARAGFRILTMEKDIGEIRRRIILYTAALVLVSLLLVPLGAAGKIYLATALVLGGIFFGYACLGFKSSDLLRWARRLFSLSLLYLTLLFLVLFFASSCARRETPVLGQLPAFQLTDQRKQSIALDTLQGRVWVANFVFTSCGHTCPLLTQRMKQLQYRLLEWKAEDPALPVNLVSFSVDPERASPEVLSAYAARYGADPALWYFLTGPVDQVEATVVRGFKIAMSKASAETVAPSLNAGEVFDVVHGEKFVLVDGQGRIRGYYDSENGQEIRRLLNDLRSLL